MQGCLRVERRQGAGVVVDHGHRAAAAVVGPRRHVRVRGQGEGGDDDPRPVVAAPGVPGDVGGVHALGVQPLGDEVTELDVATGSAHLRGLRLLGDPRPLGEDRTLEPPDVLDRQALAAATSSAVCPERIRAWISRGRSMPGLLDLDLTDPGTVAPDGSLDALVDDDGVLLAVLARQDQAGAVGGQAIEPQLAHRTPRICHVAIGHIVPHMGARGGWHGPCRGGSGAWTCCSSCRSAARRAPMTSFPSSRTSPAAGASRGSGWSRWARTTPTSAASP